MYTTYANERIRIRPVANVEEWVRMGLVGLQETAEFWGHYYEPPGSQAEAFSSTGGFDPDGELCWVIEEIATGEFIGDVYLHSDMLGYWTGTEVRSAHRGKGYGVQAKLLAICCVFDNLPVRNVYAVTLGHHRRAIRGLELCGMSFVGCQPVSYISKGRLANRVFYCISRESWLAMDYRHQVHRS